VADAYSNQPALGGGPVHRQ